MNRSEPFYVDTFTQEEMETATTRIENDPAIVPYNASQLNHVPVLPHASYQDIPLQHFRQANSHAAAQPVGLNFQVPPPTQRLGRILGMNQSLSSEIRINEMEMQCYWDGTCLGAEGGYDPRSNRRKRGTCGFNGLPQSKSARHGIDRRFPRNEASCNTIRGDVGQELLRYNTISDIPLVVSERGSARVEALNSRSSRRQSYEGKASELPRREGPPERGERFYDNVHIGADTCRGPDIDLKLSDGEGDDSGVIQGGQNCKMCFFLGLIAFVASLGGAAVYSLIGCAMAGCKS